MISTVFLGPPSGIDATEVGTLCVDDTVDSNAYCIPYHELLAAVQEINWETLRIEKALSIHEILLASSTCYTFSGPQRSRALKGLQSDKSALNRMFRVVRV